MASLQALIEVARGLAPADLVLANAQVVDVFSGRTATGDVAILGDSIVGVGRDFRALQTIDLRGRHLAPGFIDARASFESAHVGPAEYARSALAHGTTAIVVDLADVTSVCGVNGVADLLDAAGAASVDVFFCSPHLQVDPRLITTAASMDRQASLILEQMPRRVGSGGYLDCAALAQPKTAAHAAIFRADAGPLTGSAPAILGRELLAYLAHGITGDDAWLSEDEADEKLQAGVWLLAQDNDYLPTVRTLPDSVRRGHAFGCCLVTGRRDATALRMEGHVDAAMRGAVKHGMSGLQAVRSATVGPATYYHLAQRGAIAPGYVADLVAVDDLSRFQVELVVKHGKIAAHRGEALGKPVRQRLALGAASIRARPLRKQDLTVRGHAGFVRVIGVEEGELFTQQRWELAAVEEGELVADPARDILKVAVVERHKASGNVGLGFVQGFGLSRGALCTSFAPPAHPLVAVGGSDEDILLAIERVHEMQGGVALCVDGSVREALPLPVAGLLANASLEEVSEQTRKIEEACWDVGCWLRHPLHYLSSLANVHYPALRIGDRGLVDVESGALVSLQEDH